MNTPTISTPNRCAIGTVAGLATLAAVMLASLPAQAKCVAADEFGGVRLPAGCLTSDEGKIVRMRLFRADLAVAALSCNQQSQYNRVVNVHQNELVRDGRALRAMFNRLHKGKATRELNRFVTHLTNRASLRRLAAQGYCRGMARVFEQTVSLLPQDLMAYVLNRPVRSALAATPRSELRTAASSQGATPVPAKNY